ncbi:hypothetical protein [Paracoccus sp. MKU1]|uniref:hypothetical protein n=1 Tax=Paracoccus sp. MKU1 TaxID=1745182 RepID=UPI00128F50CF|nr:hypothetical protein [Paracoccus sp. MKU1]
MSKPGDSQDDASALLRTVKLYVVFQRLFAVRDGRPNLRIIDARTSRSEAEQVVRDTPGTFIEKVIGTRGGRHPRYALDSHLGAKNGNQSNRPAHHQNRRSPGRQGQSDQMDHRRG